MEGRTRANGCDECGGRIRVSETEIVCEDCGLVVDEDSLDRGPEWHNADEESDRRRTGAPLERSRHDRGLSTEIGFGTGTEVTGNRQRQLVRMRRQHNRARFSSKAERNKAYGFTEIRRLVSSLSLPTAVREQSCTLFESAQHENLLCGRSLEGFSAAAVYATCRVQSIARTMDEVVERARAEKNELKAAYDALNRELGLPVGPISPVEYLPRYTSRLDLEADVENRAREYATWLLESGRMGGKNPSGVAAACIYRAAYDHGVDVTQTDVADLANVSRMAIRSTATELKNYG
ncbi:transcription initiation factor IIB family protein [Halosolutus amylolyticus]|uniref:Transcription initiation factor IIB family protein n=1 Tax=Halosolutus amylolyticus TaxID=2932267 RepID=A0ABD5PKM0_9EURY|nr:transcription initiation factor IIB family protein [Halosolutus amylolyticus]